MRIYIPLTVNDLAAPEITVRFAHSVTRELERALPYADAEGLEYSATLSAADEALMMMRDGMNTGDYSHEPRAIEGGTGVSAMLNFALRRIVASAEVSRESIEFPTQGNNSRNEEVLPSRVQLVNALSWEYVDSILVDEPGYSDLVTRALLGDDEAFEATGDIDLLWYDVVERASLYEALRS